VIHAIDAAFRSLRHDARCARGAMASTSAEYGSPQHAVYSATKFFVRGLTEALNIEYRGHGIQVSAIYVAYVQTGMVFDAEVKPASIERPGREDHPAAGRRDGVERSARQPVPLARRADARMINFAAHAARCQDRPDLPADHESLNIAAACWAQ